MAADAEPLTYEKRLDRDSRWAMDEGDRYFAGKSFVWETQQAVARHLTDLAAPYAVIGTLAMFRHGYRRFTMNVEVLVSRADIRRIRDHLTGAGWGPASTAGRAFREPRTGVRVLFLVAGDYPGDGKPKLVAFPDPTEFEVWAYGVLYVTLPTLVNLKLAAGMVGCRWNKHLLDVQTLIKARGLPAEFAEELDPHVRATYQKLWAYAVTPDPHDQ